MDVTAESIIELFNNRERVVGLKFNYEPKYLRFFQATFKPTVGKKVLLDDPAAAKACCGGCTCKNASAATRD
jgi:hypothetical protein